MENIIKSKFDSFFVVLPMPDARELERGRFRESGLNTVPFSWRIVRGGHGIGRGYATGN
jgi:hypothetical protein